MSNTKKLYSIKDIHLIIEYMNKNYSRIEDELAKPYEDNREDLPEDFFIKSYNTCLRRAIKSLKIKK